jgi:hypothetical protein
MTAGMDVSTSAAEERVPQQWEQITPEWMTAVLRPRHPGVTIKDVSILMRDDGTNRRARLGLTYVDEPGPPCVFVKAHALAHREAHLRNGNLWNEAWLFSSGAELPLEHPHVYKAIVDKEALDFLLVMEDLRLRQADPRDATRPMTPEQAAAGLRGLAALHSRYWNVSPENDSRFSWLQTFAPTEGWLRGLSRHVPIGIERSRAVLPAALADYTGSDIVGFWSRYVGTLATAPVTLVHGDAHIGNTYLLPSGEVGFLDWQVTRRARWSQDVGYFLAGSLTMEDRRRHEVQLLEIYRGALSVPEHERPSAEAMWLEYRATPAYGLAVWLSTAGTEGYQALEVSLALCERYAAAFEELDTLSALAALKV